MGGNASTDDSAFNCHGNEQYPLFQRGSVVTSFRSPHFCASQRNPGAEAGLHFRGRDAAARDPLPSESRGNESGNSDQGIVGARTYAGTESTRRSSGGQ